jgi:small subunit ribosomal protein S21
LVAAASADASETAIRTSWAIPRTLGVVQSVYRSTAVSNGYAAGHLQNWCRNCYPRCWKQFRLEVSSLAEVHLNDGESLESALKRFKRKVLQEDIIKDIKSHAFYLKPGQKKRVKAALARKRARKKRSRDGESDQNRS